MRRLAVIPTLAALILIGAGCSLAPSSTPAAEIPAGATVVAITDGGFEPKTLTVKAGTTVYFQNTDTSNHWPASAVHPTHQEYPGFDALKPVAPGNYYRFTFDRIGTWKYHDHLNITHTASITVTP